jgi:mxaK protein
LVVRRRSVHVIFGTIALACAAVVVAQVMRLQSARHVNAAIRGATVASLDRSVPEAQIARAIALGRAGDYEGALITYKAVIQGRRADLRRLALYNLGNLHMHAALKDRHAPTDQILPLIELAKQSYRDLLRETPQDWDARYNLERALYIAPEVDEEVAEDGPPAPKEHSVSTNRAKLDLP